MLVGTRNIEDPATYQALVFSLLEKEEGVDPQIYLDSKGIPTIGVGFNLQDEDTFQAVIKGFGMDPDAIDSAKSPEGKLWALVSGFKFTGTTLAARKAAAHSLQIAMNAIVKDAKGAHDSNRAVFQFSSASDPLITPLLNTLIANKETALTRFLSGLSGAGPLGLSLERVALVTEEFNGGNGLVGPATRMDLANNDRADAWFEIRYGTAATKVPPAGQEIARGLIERQALTSDLFGLYSNLFPAGTDYLDTLGMMTAHDDWIFDAVAYGRIDPDAYIAATNSDYRSLLASIAAAGGQSTFQVLTAAQEFSPAISQLIGHYGVSGSFSAQNTYVYSEQYDATSRTIFSGTISTATGIGPMLLLVQGETIREFAPLSALANATIILDHANVTVGSYLDVGAGKDKIDLVGTSCTFDDAKMSRSDTIVLDTENVVGSYRLVQTAPNSPIYSGGYFDQAEEVVFNIDQHTLDITASDALAAVNLQDFRNGDFGIDLTLVQVAAGLTGGSAGISAVALDDTTVPKLILHA